MLAAITALLGVILGVGLSGVGLESYKRHRDRQGIASAIAGEIFGIIEMSERRQYVPWFTGMLAELEAGRDVAIPNIVANELDPVIKAYMGQLGLLRGDGPERIVKFYRYVMGIRIDLVRLSEGKLDPREKAHLIREDLGLWGETVRLGNALHRDLHAIAEEPWWLMRAWVWLTSRITKRHV